MFIDMSMDTSIKYVYQVPFLIDLFHLQYKKKGSCYDKFWILGRINVLQGFGIKKVYNTCEQMRHSREFTSCAKNVVLLKPWQSQKFELLTFKVIKFREPLPI